MKHRSLIAAVVAALIPAVVVPSNGEQVSSPSGNAEHGKTLYRETGCYQCHGLAGQGALMTGPRISRTELPLEAAIVSDRDAADIYAYLTRMPIPPEANSIPLLKVGR
jgi:cytochrome c